MDRQDSSTAITSILSSLLILYLLVLYFNPNLLSLTIASKPLSFVLDALTFMVPARLLLPRAQRKEPGVSSNVHAMKREALSGMLGLGGPAVMSKLPAGVGATVRKASSGAISLQKEASKPRALSDLPPGLGNWDNSCYQNAVLQGLASLLSFPTYLQKLQNSKLATSAEGKEQESTASSLLETLRRLNEPSNNGRVLWTPRKLKSMTSWSQQDAQEYFAKIEEEVEREATKLATHEAGAALGRRAGLGEVLELADDTESISKDSGRDCGKEMRATTIKSPLDGLLAQQVACTTCGFSEGLSLIPFNCLTVPLPAGSSSTDLEHCLDEHTKMEEISGVECGKCTLVQAKARLEAMLSAESMIHAEAQSEPEVSTTRSEPNSNMEKLLQLPPALRAQAFERLAAINTALEQDDYTDITLADLCHINKKARVSTTKTRQALLARLPGVLVVHFNRSVFDETTGALRKNYASVDFPTVLDMGRQGWVRRDFEGSAWDQELEKYMLRAVITHYGRHDNGHYICYRRYPRADSKSTATRAESVDTTSEGGSEDSRCDELPETDATWYRLSDEDVCAVEEEVVLAQGGVFMLFYEWEAIPESERRPVSLTKAVEAAFDMPAGAEITRTEPSTSCVQNDDDFDAIGIMDTPIGVKQGAHPQVPALPDLDNEITSATTPAVINSEAPHSVVQQQSESDPLSFTAQDVTEDTTEDQSAVDLFRQTQPQRRQTSSSSETHTSVGALRMRTARPPEEGAEREHGLGVGSGFRFVAAS